MIAQRRLVQNSIDGSLGMIVDTDYLAVVQGWLRPTRPTV